jgi:hypothetical protein
MSEKAAWMNGVRDPTEFLVKIFEGISDKFLFI